MPFCACPWLWPCDSGLGLAGPGLGLGLAGPGLGLGIGLAGRGLVNNTACMQCRCVMLTRV